MEMHLVSETKQTVWLPAIDLRVEFAAGESIHTENSYKYRPGDAEALLAKAGFAPRRRGPMSAGGLRCVWRERCEAQSENAEICGFPSLPR